MSRAGALTRRGFAWGLATLSAASALQACTTVVPGGPAAEPVPELAGEYTLGTGDQLRVLVYGENELTGSFQVGTQGVISYPLVGEVKASGLSVEQFKELLRSELAKYIRQPIVSVEVTNYRPYFIMGEVTHPGTYEYVARLTVQNAVATAGGYTNRANKRRVFIKHANDSQEREYLLGSTTPVMPGDTVRIGERLF